MAWGVAERAGAKPRLVYKINGEPDGSHPLGSFGGFLALPLPLAHVRIPLPAYAGVRRTPRTAPIAVLISPMPTVILQIPTAGERAGMLGLSHGSSK